MTSQTTKKINIPQIKIFCNHLFSNTAHHALFFIAPRRDAANTRSSKRARGGPNGCVLNAAENSPCAMCVMLVVSPQDGHGILNM